MNIYDLMSLVLTVNSSHHESVCYIKVHVEVYILYAYSAIYVQYMHMYSISKC